MLPKLSFEIQTKSDCHSLKLRSRRREKKHLFFAATRLTGTIVSVCDHLELNCKECGVTPEVNSAEWAVVECKGAIGSTIKVINPKNYLQACEVEIYGSQTSEGSMEFQKLPLS